MDTFFLQLKRGLVGVVFVAFALVFTYVPQPFDQVKTAEASGLAGIVHDPINWTQNAATNIATTATAASSAATSFATGSLWLKENILDGLAWALAKGVVSGMVRSLIDWINSGFNGKPQFLSDFKGFLMNIVDEEFGRYIEELGGIGSFLCSPFRLDVQLSVNLQYQRMQANQGSGQPAPTCTLSGIINNIENFISGTFTDGGFDDWFDITAQPSVYTPYGATLAAQADFQARIVNAKGEELTKLDWGDGFLSGTICNAVEGTTANPRTDCVISKPGQTIANSLNKALGAGQDALIQADEINELIAALFNQLANKAITGLTGLLGLGGATGSYDYSDGSSYLDDMVEQQTGGSESDRLSARGVMSKSLEVQIEFRDLALEYIPRFESFIFTSTDLEKVKSVEDLLEEAETIVAVTEGTATEPGTIAVLTDLIEEYDSIGVTPERRQELLIEYTRLDLYSEPELTAAKSTWDTLLR